MVTCEKCGRVNDEAVRICRFCGTALRPSQAHAATDVRDYVLTSVDATGGPQSVEAYSPPGVAAGGYRCPNCGSTYPPIAQKRISTEGWIVFCALLVFCLPLFWIGLLMKEELRICPVCRNRLS